MNARRAGVLAIVGLLFAVAGCHDPVTEIVLVVDSDLSVPDVVDQLVLEIETRTGIQRQSVPLDLGAAGASPFPATLGLVPASAASFRPFAVTATAFKRQPDGSGVLVAQRKATGVRFFKGETRALTLTLLRACACQGTSCPAPAPACADLASPTLTTFDPAHIPHVPPTDAGASPGSDGPDAGGDAANEAAPDVAAEAPNDRPAEAGAEVSPEVAPDVAPDAPSPDVATDVPAVDAARDALDAAGEAPAKLARGQACGTGPQCQDGFCVDGACCESACACGTCNGTPGKCELAAAGTDPHAECGSFACNGAGACETTCSEGFGACSPHCKAGAHCDGAGMCAPSTSAAGYFCVVDSCMCKVGLSCPKPDGGGAGRCQ